MIKYCTYYHTVSKKNMVMLNLKKRNYFKLKVKVLVAHLCLTLCDPTDCITPGYSVYGFPRQEYWSGLPCSSTGNTTVMVESEEKLKSLLMRVDEETEKAGLKFSIKKTKIMASGPITSWQIDG